MTSNISHSYSPPHTSSTEPSVPPRQALILIGLLTENALGAERSVLHLKPCFDEVFAKILSSASCGETDLLSKHNTPMPDKSYEICCAYTVMMPFIGVVILYMRNGCDLDVSFGLTSITLSFLISSNNAPCRGYFITHSNAPFLSSVTSQKVQSDSIPIP